MQPYEMNVTELKRALDGGEISCLEATQSYIDRILQTDNSVGAYLSRCFERAIDQADALDEKKARGENIGLLGGVPYALKDNIATKDIRTTCASKILENFVSPYSAHVFERLEQSGAVLLGKLDMDEFAMGSTCENSALGSVRNPFALDRVPGGSSGGSAAAVSAREAAFTLGSDTGGSIRTPSSYCSTVGLKPTYGTVSRYGLIAYASSLDQIGPITRDVADTALIMDVIGGHDKRDTTSLPNEKLSYRSYLTEGIKGMRIGIDEAILREGLDPEIKAIYLSTIEKFRELGAEIVDVHFSMLKYVVPVYYLVACSEASSNLSRFDGIRYTSRIDGADPDEIMTNTRSALFGEEVKKRIMLGTYALSAGYYDMYYNKALKVRRLISEDFASVLSGCDAVLFPTTPNPPFKLGETLDDPMTLYLADIFTVTSNLTGTPAITFPAGFTADKLPVGMQLCAGSLNEAALIKAVYNFQLATDYHKASPKL